VTASTLLRPTPTVPAQVRRHIAGAITIGCVSAVTIVVAGGRVGPPRRMVLPSTWLGIIEQTPRSTTTATAWGLVILTSMLVLMACWAYLIALSVRGVVSLTTIWRAAAAWAAPLAIGPPMFSMDVWSYSAQGQMLRRGLDPYHLGVAALGKGPSLAAVDPRWREVVSPYGPVALAIERAAATLSGSASTGTVVVLRIVATVSAIAIGVLACQLVDARYRPTAVLLTTMNPLILFQVISASHLEGVMGALMLGALVAVRKGQIPLALVLAVTGGLVKAPGLYAAAVIIVWHALPVRGRARWTRIAADVSIAMATGLLLTFLVPDGAGWLGGLTTPNGGHTPLAISTGVSFVLDNLLGLHAVISPTRMDALCRLAALGVAGAICLYLLATTKRRPLHTTIGWGLLAVAVLGPVVYPWYLLWGGLCLLPNLVARPRYLPALLALSTLVTIPGLYMTAGSAVFIGASLLTSAAMLWPAQLAALRLAITRPTALVLPAENTSVSTVSHQE
jgi:hypothetical protein